ncbi:hypothetical protein J2Y56_000187 [Pseudomonas sp. BE134]|nr:hypothetical protein [Pseudomonas sp. BE134]
MSQAFLPITPLHYAERCGLEREAFMTGLQVQAPASTLSPPVCGRIIANVFRTFTNPTPNGIRRGGVRFPCSPT